MFGLRRDVMWSRVKSLICQLIHAKNKNEEYFGINIKFLELNEGLKLANTQQRPILVVIHHEDCEACKEFRPLIGNSIPIIAMSSYFVMIGLEEESCPDQMRIDGNYTPRVIFLNSNGKVIPEFYNKYGNPRHKYFYHSDRSLIRTMKEVLAAYPPLCKDGKPCYVNHT